MLECQILDLQSAHIFGKQRNQGDILQQYSCHTNAMTSWGRAGHGSRKETVHSYTTNTARMQAYANGLSDPKFSTVGAWLGSTAEPSELFSGKAHAWKQLEPTCKISGAFATCSAPLCKFLPLLCKLELKEFPDLAVSPCKCRVPPLLAMKMSKQFEKACVGMSDP